MGSWRAQSSALAILSIGSSCSGMPLCVGYIYPSGYHLRDCAGCSSWVACKRRQLSGDTRQAKGGGSR